jgi:drug/metabolite transporter (DMT)-like permease
MTHAANSSRPATWALILAFACTYISWGTTYLAIKEGVATLPPALYGGVRITLAGLLLLGYLVVRGESLRVSWIDLRRLALSAVFMFLGGNYLIGLAEKTVSSSAASVLVATTPLWIALVELILPRGERLTIRGWLGLLIGLGGVLVLLAPELEHPSVLLQDYGPFLVLGSAFCWAIGTVVLRRARQTGNHIAAAGHQMVIGGTLMTVFGILIGEPAQITRDSFTPEAVFSFFYLLIVGSLIGYVAYTWLLGHVSAAMAGTYAYVNPAVAIAVGALLAAEPITIWLVGGMVVILAGVALVRGGGVHPSAAAPANESSRCATSGGSSHQWLLETQQE